LTLCGVRLEFEKLYSLKFHPSLSRQGSNRSYGAPSAPHELCYLLPCQRKINTQDCLVLFPSQSSEAFQTHPIIFFFVLSTAKFPQRIPAYHLQPILQYAVTSYISQVLYFHLLAKHHVYTKSPHNRAPRSKLCRGRPSRPSRPSSSYPRPNSEILPNPQPVVQGRQRGRIHGAPKHRRRKRAL